MIIFNLSRLYDSALSSFQLMFNLYACYEEIQLNLLLLTLCSSFFEVVTYGPFTVFNGSFPICKYNFFHNVKSFLGY